MSDFDNLPLVLFMAILSASDSHAKAVYSLVCRQFRSDVKQFVTDGDLEDTDEVPRADRWKQFAERGSLSTLRWMHCMGLPGCTATAMNWAASNGHLEVVKWLHENRSEGCSKWAMNWAAEKGHLEVVKFLHENRTEGCSEWAMNLAAMNGHLEVVKWIHENRTRLCRAGRSEAGQSIDSGVHRGQPRGVIAVRDVQCGQAVGERAARHLQIHDSL